MYEPHDYDVPLSEAMSHVQSLVNADVPMIFLIYRCPACGEDVEQEVQVGVRTKLPVFYSEYKHTEKADHSFCGHTVKTLMTMFTVVGLKVLPMPGETGEDSNGG